jgi:2,3-bisphosphoglycerate-independent phosphoglycerate mutase
LVFKNGHIFMKDYSAGHISTEEAGILIRELSQVINNRSFALHARISYRHLLIWHGGPEGMITLPPHDATGQDITEAWHRYEEEPLLYDLLTRATHFLYKHPVNQRRREQGKETANSLWPWGQGRKPEMPPFKEQYGLDGAVVAAVDLIRGLGRLVGMDLVDVEGATGFLDTNYAGKAAAVLETIREKDLVFMHLEAPDEAGHMGSVPEKVRAIERFDKEIVGPVWEGMKAMGVPFRILVVTDHYTPIQAKTHERGAVPFLLYDSQRLLEMPGQIYTESYAKTTGIVVEEGYKLMARLIGA